MLLIRGSTPTSGANAVERPSLPAEPIFGDCIHRDGWRQSRRKADSEIRANAIRQSANRGLVCRSR